MGLKITSAGLLTTIQDTGRFGYMASGFSQSGAMDKDSCLIANKLVFNNDLEGVLEMTLNGVSGVFTEDCVIALTGADLRWTVNDAEVRRYKALEIKKGDVIKSAASRDGMRGYLAVAGGFDINPVMGSYSTNLKCGIGGFNGKKIKNGDILPFRHERNQLLPVYKGLEDIPVFSKNTPVSIRVVLGPQEDFFSKKGIDTFLNSVYTVTTDSDRMGIRLEGEKIESVNGVDIISDGIALGSVQIPSSGKPIIMMADRQTVGGYAKIATVISADIPLLAQAMPNTQIIFEAVSLKDAQKIYKKHRNHLNLIDYRLMF